MLPPRLGLVEIILTCVFGLISVGLPVAMLVFLYLIYNKVKNIEEFIRKEGSTVYNGKNTEI